MILSQSIKKLVWQFMSGNFLSKVSGMARDVTMAYFFGADAVVAAFIVAYRMANLLRRLFGEGALVAGFIPHFESLKVKSESEAVWFFKRVTQSMALILSGLILIFSFFVFCFHYFNWASSDILYIMRMTAIMFPSILFICLYAIFSGVLQSYKKFFQTSIAPVVFNFTWIIVMLSSKHLDKKEAMIFLSFGVLLGFLCQFLFTAWHVRKILIFPDHEKGKIGFSELKPLFTALMAGVIGVGATQINNALDVIFARMASLEGPAYLTYGIRIQQLPLSVFVIALSSVILPQLSRLITLNEGQEFYTLIKTALKRSFFVLLPITVMFFLIGGSFVNVIYGRGGFDQRATIETTFCLWAYGIGLIPMGFVILMAPAFYAQKDFRVTTIASVISVSINLMFNAVFVLGFGMKSTSVAYATSVASYVNMLILSYFLTKRFGVFWDKKMLLEMAKMTAAGVVTGFIVVALDQYGLKTAAVELFLRHQTVFPRALPIQLFQFFISTAFFSLIYLIFCFVFRVEGVSLDWLRFPFKRSINVKNFD